MKLNQDELLRVKIDSTRDVTLNQGPGPDVGPSCEVCVLWEILVYLCAEVHKESTGSTCWLWVIIGWNRGSGVLDPPSQHPFVLYIYSAPTCWERTSGGDRGLSADSGTEHQTRSGAPPQNHVIKKKNHSFTIAWKRICRNRGDKAHPCISPIFKMNLFDLKPFRALLSLYNFINMSVIIFVHNVKKIIFI